MSKEKDQHGYPASPRKINDDWWFYEEPKGVYVCFDGRASALIPWRKIEAAVDNHRKAKSARKRG